MATSTEWEDRALRAAASILEDLHLPLAPPDETNVIRLMAIAWIYGTTAIVSNAKEDSAADAITDLQARL